MEVAHCVLYSESCTDSCRCKLKCASSSRSSNRIFFIAGVGSPLEYYRNSKVHQREKERERWGESGGKEADVFLRNPNLCPYNPFLIFTGNTRWNTRNFFQMHLYINGKYETVYFLSHLSLTYFFKPFNFLLVLRQPRKAFCSTTILRNYTCLRRCCKPKRFLLRLNRWFFDADL